MTRFVQSYEKNNINKTHLFMFDQLKMINIDVNYT